MPLLPPKFSDNNETFRTIYLHLHHWVNFPSLLPSRPLSESQNWTLYLNVNNDQRSSNVINYNELLGKIYNFTGAVTMTRSSTLVLLQKFYSLYQFQWEQRASECLLLDNHRRLRRLMEDPSPSPAWSESILYSWPRAWTLPHHFRWVRSWSQSRSCLRIWATPVNIHHSLEDQLVTRHPPFIEKLKFSENFP